MSPFMFKEQLLDYRRLTRIVPLKLALKPVLNDLGFKRWCFTNLEMTRCGNLKKSQIIYKILRATTRKIELHIKI